MAQSTAKKLNTVTKAKINNDLIASQIHLGYNSNSVSQHNLNMNGTSSNHNNETAKMGNLNGVSTTATTTINNNIVSQKFGESSSSAKPADDAGITQHPINASIHQNNNNNQNAHSPSPNNNNWDLESQEGHVPRKVNI